MPSNILNALTKRNKQTTVKNIENDFVLIVNSLIEKTKLLIERFFSKKIVEMKIIINRIPFNFALMLYLSSKIPTKKIDNDDKKITKYDNSCNSLK
tara:strand:+ start:4079 stop:4366 length:288 start_codon:yes stop_codon:yes gene_type:complete